ncbi:MAG TPA: ABC transporter permease [Chitinophagaceae bacterium]|nr:ABC transporter permease [Chitinophagaceae bacterium]
MLRNYFKTALRNLVKHKVFSFINIFGLALGIAACLLILQYVRFERSYDRFHEKGDRIFRVQQDRYDEGKLSTRWAAGAAGIGPAVLAEVPEVEAFAKLTRTSGVVSYKEEKFREERMYFATDSFLPMFSYKVLQGNARGALAEPNTAVITAATARKYFGGENPVGKIISRNREEDYRVTAVVADMPPNTHLKFDVLLSFATYVQLTSSDALTTFNWDGFYTYLLLKPGANLGHVEKKITEVAARKNDPEGTSKQKTIELHLQPLRDIHLTSHFMEEAEVNGNGKSVTFLLIIAVFIIVIAWVNYINLATARALERAREVGVRKVMGSHRWQLVRQFLFESFLINLLAVVLAFLIVVLALPLFNSVTGNDVKLSLLTDSGFWTALVCIYFGGTLLSGIYPAFVLSSIRPIEVLKGKLARSAHGHLLRQALVVFQFAASFALVVGTYSVYRQLEYMESQDLGVQVDQTLILRGPNVTDSTYGNKLAAFKAELLRHPQVAALSASSSVPGNKVGWNAGGIGLVGSDKTNQYRVFAVDHDFTGAYGLKVLAGRPFSRQFPSDTGAVLFNEAAVAALGFRKPEEAVGRQIQFWGDVFTIVGVVANHHQESLREAYDSYIYRLDTEADNFYSVKIKAGAAGYESIIGTAREHWDDFFPGNPFDYFFLDDQVQKQYEADRLFGRTFALFAVLAIIVACLGLFGLVSFVTTQRTKEIGIRKVSGAGVRHILLLLTRDFIKPILIALLLALPVSYYFVRQWLQDFAFKIDISAGMFLLPAGVILLIALVTINTKTFRIATANPMRSLRTE